MLKVLIADDSDLLRERLIRALVDVPGIELVGQATSGRETLKAIQHLKPNVLILDIRMPDGNGLQTLRTIKADEHAPTVIVLTAYPFPQYRRSCREAGAEFFFEKNGEFDRVSQVITELVTQSPGEKIRGIK